MRTLPPIMHAAMLLYYSAKSVNNGMFVRGGDKQVCLEAIRIAGELSGFKSWEVCAGTIWLTWHDGFQSQHNQTNWQECRQSECNGAVDGLLKVNAMSGT